METIKCAYCKEEKNENEFNIFHGRRNKQCNSCRKYHNEYYANNGDSKKEKAKIFYQENKETFKDRAFRQNLKSKYSLTVHEYEEMVLRQNNKCLICGNEFSEEIFNKPCVDHNHDTGEIRGLLCRKCNVSLSYIENEDFLQKALQYLGKSMK